MDAMQPPSLDRRRFLLTGAAAAAGLAALPAAAQAAPLRKQDKDPFGGFNVGIQSFTYRQFKLEQCLVQVQKLGLHWIEFYNGHVPLDATPAQIKAVVNLCREYQITPAGFGVERFTKDHNANRRTFEFGRNLGVRYLSADPDPDSFDSLDKLVAEFKIAIAIHPHGPSGKQLHRWYNAETILGAVKKHNALIGTCLDTGHLIRCAQPPFGVKLDPAAEIRRMGDRNFAIHLKDHDNKQRTDVVFGRGALDVPAVLRALREVKFQGTISIEYEANAKNPTPDVQACLDVFRESVRKLA
jgi:sugar phosphate isomerase/epimerase